MVEVFTAVICQLEERCEHLLCGLACVDVHIAVTVVLQRCLQVHTDVVEHRVRAVICYHYFLLGRTKYHHL